MGGPSPPGDDSLSVGDPAPRDELPEVRCRTSVGLRLALVEPRISAAAFFGQGSCPAPCARRPGRPPFGCSSCCSGTTRDRTADGPGPRRLRCQGEGAARQSARARRHTWFESLPIGQLKPAKPSTEGIECHNADPDAQPQAWCYQYQPLQDSGHQPVDEREPDRVDVTPRADPDQSTRASAPAVAPPPR